MQYGHKSEQLVWVYPDRKEVSKTYVTVDDKLEDIYCESGALWIKGRDDLKIICCMYSFKAHQRGITFSEHLQLIDS